MTVDRGNLMQRGWEACVSDREAPLLGHAPQTMAWLWDLAAVVQNNAAVLPTFSAEQLDQWVGDRAAKEAMVPTLPIGRVLAICAELKTWDLDDLAIVNPSGALDRLARRHLGAVAQRALRAMAEAVIDYPSGERGLRALLRLAADAALAATAKRVKADEPDPDRVIEVLGWRSDRYFEAVVVYLEDVGVVEPENRARVLIRDEQQRQEQS